MNCHYNPSIYRQNAAKAEALLLREISKRQLRGYKFRRQSGKTPMSVEFICAELKLVIQLYSEHFYDDNLARSPEQLANDTEFKGFQVARICHSEVLTNLIGVIESLSAVIRQCKQAMQMSRMACQYLSQGIGRG